MEKIKTICRAICFIDLIVGYGVVGSIETNRIGDDISTIAVTICVTIAILSSIISNVLSPE